jgi:CheY-like chemotaxis protein
MLKPLRILLIDDNHDTADSLAEFLLLCGFPAQVVYDSSVALATVTSEQLDVFIADIGMPHLNGFDLAFQITARGAPKPLMIAVTGYDHAPIREQCRKAGFDHFFVKPADPDELLSLLRHHADCLSREVGPGSE